MTDIFQFRSTLERSDNKLWGAHVRVPDSIAKKFPDQESRRVVCELNGAVSYQTAILAYSEGVWVLRVNRALMKKLDVDFGDELAVEIRSDRSEFGLPRPEELEELLAQDKEGADIFHALTPGKQRTLLHIINSVKSSEKRIHRALIIVRHLKALHGKIDFRKLAVEMKSQR